MLLLMPFNELLLTLSEELEFALLGLMSLIDSACKIPSHCGGSPTIAPVDVDKFNS